MKKFPLSGRGGALGLALLALSVLPVTRLAAQDPGEKVPDRYIVEVAPGATPRGIARSHRITPDVVFQSAVNGFAGVVPAGRLRALRNDPRVVAVTPDRVVTAYPKGGNGGGGGKPGPGNEEPAPREPEVIPEGVARIGASPGLVPFTGSGVGIAIVDTGLDFNHEDLGIGSVSFKSVVKGRTISTSEGPTVGQDDEGHGTHVGGISAARADGFDVVGVAPGATLFAVKVLDGRGRGYDSTVIDGLDWVAANAATTTPPIRVVNLSLGREGTLNDNLTYRAAIQALVAQGITVVVAAGNDSLLEVSQQVPATYPEVLAVASSTAVTGESDIAITVAADTASFFTTDGSYNPVSGIGVTISAPGAKQEDIANGFVSSIGILSAKLGGGTIRHSGTSMACPHVAGVAALLYEQLGSIDAETVRSRIMGGASAAGTAPLDSPTTSYTFDGVREGILDVAGALGL